MDPTKATLVAMVCFVGGILVGMVLLFMFEERLGKQDDNNYTEEDDEVSQCNNEAD